MHRIMIGVIATSIAVQQAVNCYVTGAHLWYVSQFLSMLETATVLCFLTAVIPYKQLMLKTLSGAWCATVTTDCVIYPLWFVDASFAEYSQCVQLVVCVVVCFYICIKSYGKIQSDEIEQGYIYQVRAIPHTFRDAVLSVIYLRPFGGTGVICHENWYHYRKGCLERSPISQIPSNKFVILRTRKESPSDKTTLDNLVNERWTWTKNCVTKLHPFSLKK